MSDNEYQAHDWIGMGDLEKWYGSVGEKETLDGLLSDTDNKLREWFADYDYVELDSSGNRHERTDGENTVVVIGLLDYWREKVNEHRRLIAE